MTNGRAEVITSVERWRRWSSAEKEQLVAASLERCRAEWPNWQARPDETRAAGVRQQPIFLGLAGSIARIARRFASGLYGHFARRLKGGDRLPCRLFGFAGHLARSRFDSFPRFLLLAGRFAPGIACGAGDLWATCRSACRCTQAGSSGPGLARSRSRSVDSLCPADGLAELLLGSGIHHRFALSPGLGFVVGKSRPDPDIRCTVRSSNVDAIRPLDDLAEHLDRRFGCDDLRGYRALLGGGIYLRFVAAPGRVFHAPGFVAGLNRPDRNIRCIFRLGNRVGLVDGFTEFFDRRFSCDDLNGDPTEKIVDTICRRGIQRLRWGAK
jgi:hypothetical protein